MKCYLLPFLFFTLVITSGCISQFQRPLPTIKLNYKEIITEKTLSPSGNIITEKSYSKEDLSSSTPTIPPPPTLWQKIKSFIWTYSLIFGIILFLCPSVGVIILKIILNRTRSAFTQVVGGVQDFMDKDNVGNDDLKNALSKKMDRASKEIVKRLK